MKEYKVKEVINRLQDEAGYATSGYVDRLVFSGLDVHEMLNEIEQAIIEDISSVEKLQEQLNTAKKALTEAIGYIEQLNGSDDTIKYYKQALAAIGGDK